MALNLVTERRHLNGVLWLSVLCIGFKGILYTFRRFVTLAGQPIPDQGVGSHEEAFFFDCFIVLLMVLSLCGTHKKLRAVMWILLPVVISGEVACNRRAATAAFIVVIPMLILAAYRALPDRRRIVGAVGIFLAISFPIYYQAFKNSPSMYAEPARAVKSQFEPDERDASSNAYRDAEATDLYATIKSSPIIGYGYGKPMFHVAQIADISQQYEWWDILTHNQILWVWMRVGTIGFFTFWMMICAILVYGASVIQLEGADAFVKTVGIFTMLITGMLLIFGLLDLQLSNFRDMLFVGMWLGLLGSVSEMAPTLVTGGSRQISDSTESEDRFDQNRTVLDRTVRARTHVSNRTNRIGNRTNRIGNRTNRIGNRTNGSGNRNERKWQPNERSGTLMSQSRLVAKNVVTSLATQIVTWALAIAVTRFLPAYLGDARLGQLSLAGAVTSIFGVFISLGTTIVLVKDVARDRQQLGELLAGSLLIRIPMSLLMALFAIVSGHLLGYELETQRLIMISSVGMIIGTLNDLLSASLQGQENMPRANIATLTDEIYFLWIDYCSGDSACAALGLCRSRLVHRNHRPMCQSHCISSIDSHPALATPGNNRLLAQSRKAVFGTVCVFHSVFSDRSDHHPKDREQCQCRLVFRCLAYSRNNDVFSRRDCRSSNANPGTPPPRRHGWFQHSGTPDLFTDHAVCDSDRRGAVFPARTADRPHALSQSVFSYHSSAANRQCDSSALVHHQLYCAARHRL